MRIVTLLAHRLIKARLAIAEQDLAWMEAHAPAALDRQRKAVRALRRRVDADVRSADDVARDVTRKLKAGAMT